MTKWSELTRSEAPWNWKETLERVVLTPERFNDFLYKLITERKIKMDETKPVVTEEPVDMDEESKSTETLDEAEIDEELDPEPSDVKE